MERISCWYIHCFRAYTNQIFLPKYLNIPSKTAFDLILPKPGIRKTYMWNKREKMHSEMWYSIVIQNISWMLCWHVLRVEYAQGKRAAGHGSNEQRLKSDMQQKRGSELDGCAASFTLCLSPVQWILKCPSCPSRLLFSQHSMFGHLALPLPSEAICVTTVNTSNVSN